MTSDYEEIFYFDANKNLYKGSFYWKHLQFQFKKKKKNSSVTWYETDSSNGLHQDGKTVTSAKGVVDSGNNLTALVSEILRYLLVSRELHVIPKLQYRFCKTTHSLENLENKTFVVCILLSPQE